MSHSTDGGESPKGRAVARRRALLLGLLGLAVLAATAGSLVFFLGPGDRGAAPVASMEGVSGGESRIAFVDPEGRLGTVAPDGTDRRFLTQPGRFYQFPAWSPIGNELAVIGTDSQGGGLYVTADEPDGGLRRLYAHPEETPVYLYWSPDGKRVSFIASHRDGLALHVVPAEGAAGSRVVATGPDSFFWHWLPDGERVFIHTGFTALPGALTRLAFVPVHGEGDEDEVAQEGFFQAPAVSADGQYYAFGNTDPFGQRWLVVHETETGFTKWLEPHGGVVAMGWSPIKAQLAHISPVTSSMNFYGPLRVLDMEAGDTRILALDTVLAFFWSPDGRSIAYLTLSEIERQEESNLVRLNLWVADVETGEQSQITTFRPSDPFVDQFLPFFDNYALSHRVWSPDGQAVVLPLVDENGRNQIVVAAVDGGDPVPVAEGVVAFWSHL